MKPTRWKPRYPKESTACACGCRVGYGRAWAGGYNGMAVILGCKGAVDAWIKERERNDATHAVFSGCRDPGAANRYSALGSRS